jgi:hypothetical protein
MQAREIDELVVVAVVVQHPGSVSMRAGGDQQVRGRRAPVVPAARQFGLGRERCGLDIVIDGEVGEPEQISEKLVVLLGVARRPACLEQERDPDCDLALLDHRCNLDAAPVGQRRQFQSRPRRVVDQQQGLCPKSETLDAIGAVGILTERPVPYAIGQASAGRLRGWRGLPQPLEPRARTFVDQTAEIGTVPLKRGHLIQKRRAVGIDGDHLARVARRHHRQ